MSNPTLREMMENGVHFGHVKSRWHPKMKPFIFTERDKVHIIDLEQTKSQLDKGLAYLSELVAKGGIVLFVGTKKQAKDLVKKAANTCEMPYISERWFGGALTNFDVLRKNVKVLEQMEQDEKDGGYAHLTKKEVLHLTDKKAKLLLTLEGVRNMTKRPDALFVVDAGKEDIAIKEATLLKLPVVALVDTNTNPDVVEYPIPANDDATKSLTLIMDYVGQTLKTARQGYVKTAAATDEKVTETKA
ncbi:MAG: 30S ribosomal protein S2 [Patescibacteria group bacterium]|jgi:small subunit ribosomal protein S2